MQRLLPALAHGGSAGSGDAHGLVPPSLRYSSTPHPQTIPPSRHTHSSNVVERCLKLGGGETSSLLEERDAVVEELMTSPSFGRLLQDPYANYVMQSALSVTSGARHAALVEAIRPFLPALRGTPHGKRILAKIAIKV